MSSSSDLRPARTKSNWPATRQSLLELQFEKAASYDRSRHAVTRAPDVRSRGERGKHGVIPSSKALTHFLLPGPYGPAPQPPSSASLPRPYIDAATSSEDVSALVGKQVILTCVVRDLGNESVSVQ